MNAKIFNKLVSLAQFDRGLARHKSSGRYGPAVPYFAAEYRAQYDTVLGALMRRHGARAVKTEIRRAKALGWSVAVPEKEGLL